MVITLFKAEEVCDWPYSETFKSFSFVSPVLPIYFYYSMTYKHADAAADRDMQPKQETAVIQAHVDARFIIIYDLIPFH